MTTVIPGQRIYAGATEAGALLKEDELVWPSAGFDPVALGGLMVWLDASQLGLADGAAVSPWPDLSGTSHHGTIVGTPAPKVRTNTLNGLPVVRFTINEGRVRGNNGLVSGLPTFNFTLVYVARMVGPSIGRIFAGSYPSVNFLVGYHTSAYDSMYDNAWVNTGVPWPALPTPWKMHGADASHDGTNYLSRFLINGVVSGTITAGTGLAQGYNLSGYDITGTPETCDCEVAELVIYNHKLTDPERVEVEEYLRAKWGL